MLKKIHVAVLFAVLISTLPIGRINFNFAEAVNYSGSGTYVGGIIWENTTWTAENSPYIITETVQIPENVMLTIEPGVTVICPMSGDMFLLHGRIEAYGTVGQEIIFDGGGNSNFFNPKKSVATTFLNLSYCIIQNGLSLWPPTGYEQYGSFNIRYCKLINLAVDSFIWYPQRDIYIEYNTFINSAGFSVGHSGPSVYVRYNLFKGNKGFFVRNWASYAGQTIVKYNSFIDVRGIVLELPSGYSSAAMLAAENYWGTNDTDIIDSMIYDKKDDITCAGFIEYLPILTEPHHDTPMLPLMVNFTYSPTTVYACETVTFDASASFGSYSSIVNYTWDFGDGNITTTLSPKIKHGYAMPGNYDVTLIVTDEFGFRNSTTTSITVLEDNVSPVTIDNYDDEWRNKDFTVALIATDHESGIAETYYRINNGPVKAVSTNGQPLITVEGANNTLEYWSVDNVGNEEPHKMLTCIKLDKTEPSSSINFEGIMGENGWFVSNVTATLRANDTLSGIDSLLYSFDNVKWENYVGPFNISDEGQVTIYFKSADKAGNIEIVKMETIKIDKTPPIANAGLDRTAIAGETVNFDASASTDNIGLNSHEWDFGDGTTGTGITVSHTYTSPGTYAVTLTVKDAAGNMATHSITTTVEAPHTEALPMWIIGVAIAALAIVTAVATTILRKRRK